MSNESLDLNEPDSELDELQLPNSTFDEGFTQQFALEVAMDWRPVSEVCEAHRVTREQWLFLCQYEPFLAAVAAHLKYVVEDGSRFRQMARIAAQDAPAVVHRLMHHADRDATRLGAAKLLGEWSTYGVPATGDREGVVINIVVGQDHKVEAKQLKDVDPLTDRAVDIPVPVMVFPVDG